MPANLNALLRYKTINDCLSTGRGYTIDELMEACGDALGEYRGKYGPVAERTIREDIKVMRSDMLGLNAPIVQKDGLYFYSDCSYHLINVIFSGAEVIQKVIKLLDEYYMKSPEPEVDEMIRQLKAALAQRARGKSPDKPDWMEERLEHGIPGLQHFRTYDSTAAPRKPRIPKPSAPTWGDLFRLVFRKK